MVVRHIFAETMIMAGIYRLERGAEWLPVLHLKGCTPAART